MVFPHMYVECTHQISHPFCWLPAPHSHSSTFMSVLKFSHKSKTSLAQYALCFSPWSWKTRNSFFMTKCTTRYFLSPSMLAASWAGPTSFCCEESMLFHRLLTSLPFVLSLGQLGHMAVLFLGYFLRNFHRVAVVAALICIPNNRGFFFSTSSLAFVFVVVWLIASQSD